MPKTVILLKTPSESSESQGDPYVAELASLGYAPLIVPTIEHTLVHIDDLADIIHRGPDRFDGVIITSARSAEAWSKAVTTIVVENPSEQWVGGGESNKPPFSIAVT